MSSSMGSFSSRFPGPNLVYHVARFLINDIKGSSDTDSIKFGAIKDFVQTVYLAYVTKLDTSSLDLTGLKALVKELGAPFYEKGEGGSFWVTLQSIFQGRTKDRVALELAFIKLNQMQSAQVCADRYLKAMEIGPPEDKKCADWAVKLDIEAAEKSYEIFDLVEGWRKDLFPPHISADSEDGNQQPKELIYVSEALFRAGLSVPQARKKLDELYKMLQKDVAQQARLVKKVPEVREGIEVLRREMRKRDKGVEGAAAGNKKGKGKGKKGKGKGGEKEVVKEVEKEEEEKEEAEEKDAEANYIEDSDEKTMEGLDRILTSLEWNNRDAIIHIRGILGSV